MNHIWKFIRIVFSLCFFYWVAICCVSIYYTSKGNILKEREYDVLQTKLRDILHEDGSQTDSLNKIANYYSVEGDKAYAKGDSILNFIPEIVRP